MWPQHAPSSGRALVALGSFLAGALVCYALLGGSARPEALGRSTGSWRLHSVGICPPVECPTPPSCPPDANRLAAAQDTPAGHGAAATTATVAAAKSAFHAPLYSHVHPTWSIGANATPAPLPPTPPPLQLNESALWRTPVALDPRGLQRGILSYGDPARLRRVVHALATGRSVVAVGVGASITAGGGATPGWPSYLMQVRGCWICGQ